MQRFEQHAGTSEFLTTISLIAARRKRTATLSGGTPMTVRQWCKEIRRALESQYATLSDDARGERDLGNALNLQTGLDWKRAPRPQFRDFFGFGEDRADYQPKSDARMIIEFKVLRERREYDFKNGLAQLLVQAIALPAER